MKTSLARVVLIASVAFLVWAGCSKKGSGPVEPKSYNEVFMVLYAASPLAGGFSYELWAKPADTSLLVSDSSWKRLTRFNISASGGLLDSNGTLIADSTIKNLPVNLEDCDSIQVTIERTSDYPTTPSSTVYLLGVIPPNLDSAKIVQLEFPAFAGAASGYCDLLTPTDSDTSYSNELSGVWFMMRELPGPSDSGLFIPPAPTGWLYEGWVSHGGSWLSTGKFRSATGPDMANPYCGEATPPQFPGEDFLQHAPVGIGFAFPFVLTSGDSVKVTLQPDPDPGTSPFGTIVLSTEFTATPVPHTLFTLMPAPNSIPSGTATIYQAGGR